MELTDNESGVIFAMQNGFFIQRECHHMTKKSLVKKGLVCLNSLGDMKLTYEGAQIGR